MTKLGMPTMKEVAAVAGVSQPTVSRALKNDPRISKATRKRVLSAVKQLDYRPNAMVSTLMAQLHTQRPQHRTPTIAAVVAVDRICNRRFSSMGEATLRGATECAKSLGYSVEVIAVDPDGREIDAAVRTLSYRNVVGILVMPMPWSMREIVWPFEKFASAAIGKSLQKPELNQVGPDHYGNLDLLIEEIQRQGYQRIGFYITSEMSEQVDGAWLASYSRRYYSGDSTTFAPLVVHRFDAKTLIEWREQNQFDAVIMKETWLLGDAPEAYLKCRVFTPGRLSSGDVSGINEDAEEIGAHAMRAVVAQINENQIGLPMRPYVLSVRGRFEA